MATSLFLACDAHRQFVAIAERGILGSAAAISDAPVIAAFAVSHRECSLRIIDEHSAEHDESIPGYGDGSWNEWESTKAEDLEP